MPTVTFINAQGEKEAVPAVSGATLMEAALSGGVSGILGDCGGACSCATCHVYIDPSWIEQVGPAAELEDEMLELAIMRQDNSRLSCQINVTEELDGLIVHLPVSQT